MQMHEGVVTRLTGGSVVIELNGRLGQLSLPLRMVVCDRPPRIGDVVRFMMTYPEVVGGAEVQA